MSKKQEQLPRSKYLPMRSFVIFVLNKAFYIVFTNSFTVSLV
jgi:hypothetical protein